MKTGQRHNTVFDAWLAETRTEMIKLLRAPAFLIPTIVLPLVLFTVFGVAMSSQNGGAEGTRYLLASYGAFAMIAASMFGVGVSVAVERERGMLLLKRALPMPPGAWFGGKVITALFATSITTVLLMLDAALFAHLKLPLWQWPALWLMNCLGSLPFCAIGLFIGSRVSGSAAPGITNLVYVPMAFLSGLWMPLSILPPMIGKFAVIWPAYHFVQLPLAVIGSGDGSDWTVHLVVLIVIAVVLARLALPRLVGNEGAVAKPGGLRRGMRIGGAIAIAAAIFAGTWHPATDSSAVSALPTGNRYAIRHVRLFDGRDVTQDTTVLVDGGRIAAIGPDLKLPAGIDIIDGKGRSLLPGLIDAHCHAFGNARRDALRFGVTTLLDMMTVRQDFPAWRRQRESLDRSDEADLWAAGFAATAPGGHGTEYGFPVPTVAGAAQARAFVDARKADGSDYLKIILEDGSEYHSGLHFNDLDDTSLQAVIDAAKADGLMTVTHVETLVNARRAIADGVDGLAHVFADASADEAFMTLVAERKPFMTATLSVYAPSAGPEMAESLLDDPAFSPLLSNEQLASLTQKAHPAPDMFAHALDNTRRLHQAGLRILAGTDSPNPGTAFGVSLHGELELLVRAGFTPVEALRAATSLPAEVFRLGDRGSIVVGNRADLLLVEGDPTARIGDTRHIVAIMKNGYIVDRALPANEKPDTETGMAPPTDGRFADFEDGRGSAQVGDLTISTDKMANGNSVATTTVTSPGADGSAHALAVDGELKSGFPYPWAGISLLPAGSTKRSMDFSSRKALLFRVRGDGHPASLMVFSGRVFARPQDIVPFTPGADWVTVRIPLDSLTATDLKQVRGLAFSAAQPLGRFHFEIDDIHFE